jgi:hypothetical protein
LGHDSAAHTFPAPAHIPIFSHFSYLPLLHF